MSGGKISLGGRAMMVASLPPKGEAGSDGLSAEGLVGEGLVGEGLVGDLGLVSKLVSGTVPGLLAEIEGGLLGTPSSSSSPLLI